MPSVNVEGCPVILLTSTGGLGYEWQSGVIAAVWRSGVIVRADSAKRPWGAHRIGRLSDADLADLIELVNASWTSSSDMGMVAIDDGDHNLTLRRESQVRSWAETPGVTSTATVAQFRTKLLAVPLPQPSRATGSFDDIWGCLQ